MKNILILILTILVIFFGYHYFKNKNYNQFNTSEEVIYGDGIDDPRALKVLDDASMPNPRLDEILGADGKPLK